MKYVKGSIEYDVNRAALQEMEEDVPMTLSERNAIRNWVHKGHELESNPWKYTDELGYELNYLQAYRMVHGYSHGPWDTWNGPASQPVWDEKLKCFVPKDEM